MRLQTASLAGRTVAITGATGGLGVPLCERMCALGADLILLDRNPEKSERLERRLVAKFPGCRITRIRCELESTASVDAAIEALIALSPDFFVANAGAYAIPRHLCDSGYDNVFQINFVSPYRMAVRLSDALPALRVVAVGSIAHTYTAVNEADFDFRTCQRASHCYGNAKRLLMLSLATYFAGTDRLAIVHPGITFTGITAHYPKLIFAIIKYPMKVIFPTPYRASECLLAGLFHPTPYGSWIGPRVFGIWGAPKRTRLGRRMMADADKAERIAAAVCKGTGSEPLCEKEETVCERPSL